MRLGSPRGQRHGRRSRPGPHTGNPAIRRLNAAYRTPEAEYVLDDLWPYGMFVIAGVLYFGWFSAAVWDNAFGWPLSWRALAATNGIAGAVIIAHGLNLLLRIVARGLLAPGIDGRLLGEFAPGRFRLRIGRRYGVFDARRPHQFLMCEHRLRMEEGRAEELARAHGAKQQANHYRRAWHVVLDYGGARYLLASVADEHGARKLVRRLQAMSAYAAGDTGAGTRTRTGQSTDGAPSAKRPRME